MKAGARLILASPIHIGLSVAERRGPRAPAYAGPSIDPDLPTAGCYRIKLRKGAPDSAVRIWLGASIDPETEKEVEERPLMWQASINGQRVPLERVWPGCARDPISEAEHDRIKARNATLDEESPFYDPRQPVDLSTAPPPF
jgi:hypothetical protein